MDFLNLGALFQNRRGDNDAADYLTYSSTSPQSRGLSDNDSAGGGVHNNEHPASRNGDAEVSGRRGMPTDSDDEDYPTTQKPSARPELDGHNDPTNDTQSLQSYWHALFAPNVYMAIFYALRITLLVALPLGILSRHPNTMHIFPAAVVMSLWGVVDCRYTFGEQVAANICSLQCVVVFMTWGVMNNAWNLHDHKSAWWCSVFFCAFFISLFGDVRARRVVLLHCVIILQMESLPNGTTLKYPTLVGRDYVISTGFAFFQCLWPVKSIAADCDSMMAEGWKHIGKIARNCATACWSEDPMECVIALTRIGTQPVQSLFSTLPGKLFFVMYEFWESTLRLELRRERLTVMELCMPRLHTMKDTARAIVMHRVHQTQVRQGSEERSKLRDATSSKHRQQLRRHVQQPSSANAQHDFMGKMGDGSTDQLSHEPYADQASADDVHGNDGERREPPRHNSVLVMEGMSQTWARTSRILKPATDNFLDALDAVLDGLGKHLNPRETAEKVPFAELREAATDLQSKLDEVHFEALIKSETPVDPFLYSNAFVFHLSLIVLAERLLAYGDSMQNFDRSRYKSQLQRAWEFFFYDYWKGFWEELPKRITLATPRDVRMFKDAIKMACAFTVGALYTEQMDPEHVYYFGMAILMGVGWPTAGDTMEASIYRISGMACACSIAYVAVWHTHNLAGELAIALAGVFIALLFRDRPPYAHTAQYCAMLLITSLSTASTKDVVLSRIVSNCFTVMSYYAIVVFIFPIDTLRVTYNAQVRAIKLVANQFSHLVDVINQPKLIQNRTQMATLRPEVLRIHNARLPMWGALNAVGMWIPKAAADPAPLGNPYPLQAMRDMYSSLRRLGSATDVICASLMVLMREGAPERRPGLAHVFAAIGPVMRRVDETARVLFQDFLDALSKPHEWSPKDATYHFSVFLSLSSALHDAYWRAHCRYVRALRSNFRSKVMNRTFAAAAVSDVIDPRDLERAQSLSVDVPPQRDDAFADDEHDPRDDHGNTSPSRYGASFDPVNVATPHSTQPQRRPSTTRNAPPVTNGSIAHTIAESVAIVRSTERRNSQLVSSPAGNTLPGSATDATAQQQQDEAAEQIQCAKEQAEFEKALDPYERQAHEEERRAFIARRSLDHAHAEEITLSHDVNMVLTIMVGTNMFFTEAERLLTTMYAINEYARSRQPALKLKNTFFNKPS